MRIYQIYSLQDMANSDSFYPTMALVETALKGYGLRQKELAAVPALIKEGQHRFEWVLPEGDTICLEVHDIQGGRVALANALQNLPCR